MDANDVSVRELARRWRPQENNETNRRSINRYLHSGIVPNPGIRHELAEALGVPTVDFDPEEEEEEAALRTQLMDVLMATLAELSGLTADRVREFEARRSRR